MALERIREVLTTHVGVGHRWSITRIHRNHTPVGLDVVYRATAAGRALAVKANCRPERNRREFHALQQMQRVGATCAGPIHLAEDGSFYVMQWLDGADLRRRMRDADRLQVIAAAGRWLRDYHSRTSRRLPWRDSALIGPVLPGETSAEGLAVAAQIARRRRALVLHRGPMAALHTDFQLQNLAHDAGRISAYDPVSHRVGHIYFDVSRFLIGAALHRELASHQGRGWTDDGERDRQVFLRAYGGIPRIWRRQFELIVDIQLARLWRNFALRQTIDAGASHRSRIIARMMRRRGLLPAAG